MSGEVGRAKRIAFARLQPADVLFFGARGPSSSPSEVNHSGIYLGGGWMIRVELGRRGGAARRLVPAAIRLGAAATHRSRLDLAPSERRGLGQRADPGISPA